MKRLPNKPRAIEDILASGVARLSSEAPRVVPYSYPTLNRMVHDGRLRVSGRPAIVDIAHLRDQVEKGFPKLDAEVAA